MNYGVVERNWEGEKESQRGWTRIHKYTSLQNAFDNTQLEIFRAGTRWEDYLLIEFVDNPQRLEEVVKRPDGKSSRLVLAFSSLHNYYFWITATYPYPLVLADADVISPERIYTGDHTGWTNWLTNAVWDAVCAELDETRCDHKRNKLNQSLLQHEALFPREKLHKLLTQNYLKLGEYNSLLRVPQQTGLPGEGYEFILHAYNQGDISWKAAEALAEAFFPPATPKVISCPRPTGLPRKVFTAESAGAEPPVVLGYIRKRGKYILTDKEPTYTEVESSWWYEVKAEVRAKYPGIDWTWNESLGRTMGVLRGPWAIHLWYVGSTGREPSPWRARVVKATPGEPYQKEGLPLMVGGTWEQALEYVLQGLELSAEAWSTCGDLFHD